MPETDPIRIAEALDAALNAHNLEAVLNLFADDAVLRYDPPVPSTGDVYTGKAQIRMRLQAVFAQGLRVEAGEYEASGDKVTSRPHRVFADAYAHLGASPMIATTELIIREGKIQSMTVRFSPESVAKIEAAAAEPANRP